MFGTEIKCDGSGCITACCKGCSCCIAKTGIIQSKDNEITTLKQKVLELMTRQTTIGSAERLSQENQRLRAERNHYRDNNEEANKLVAKLTTSLTNLTEKVKRLEKNNQELKNKVERISNQIETPNKH
jgi:predicted nuclease with TOPRIM domain